MQIEVLSIEAVRKHSLSYAVEQANMVQREFEYSILEGDEAQRFQLFAFDQVDAPGFLADLKDLRHEIRGYHPFIIAFVDGALSCRGFANLFAFDLPDDGIGVTTIANVPDVILPADKMSAYFVYRLAKQTLNFIAPDHKNHDETRACVYDKKISKLDIIRSMKVRALCDQCRRALLSGASTLSGGQLAALDVLFGLSGKLLSEIDGDRRKRVPRIFVGSSTEGLPVANAVQGLLAAEFNVEVWNQGTIFGLGNATLEDLESAVLLYDFGIFVFTPDDTLESRGFARAVARDNVLFEFGLFAGKLTRKRAFIVRAPSVSLPSDLSGITTASYNPDAPNLTAALGPATNSIRRAIEIATANDRMTGSGHVAGTN